jgi:hypothetical protein
MVEPMQGDRRVTNRPDAVLEGRGLVLAGLLAALAGFVDATGYLHLSGLFVSYMSGNSTQLAVALGQGDPGEAGTIAELVALFVLGAAAGQVLAGFAGKWHLTWVLIGVTILLAIAGALGASPEPMVLAMGALNAATHRREHSGELDLCDWGAGSIWPGIGRFHHTSHERMELARASRTLGRADHRCDARRRGLPADWRGGNLGSGRLRRPHRRLFGDDPAARLKRKNHG